jgi:chemotaxis signal transduction protein
VILDVREIKGYSAVTPIPNTPPTITGVENDHLWAEHTPR